MRKQSMLFRRKAAGMMAAVMMFSVLPVPAVSFAEMEDSPLGILTSEYKKAATASNAQKATASNALKAMAASIEGTTYYVDAENGDDTADGKSEETAWKTFDRVNAKTFLPGDKILLKADGIWNQPLNPKGSGRDGEPIIIDMYGEGKRPVINGNGTSGPSITGAVTIYNEEYWEIYNLEVTNLEATDKPGEAMDSGTSERAGILIYSSNQEKIYKHIVVKNCYVHDVNSSFSGMKTSGGIIVVGHYLDKDGNRVTVDDNGNLTAKAMGRAAFEDVLIEGNYVKNVAIEGIRNKCNTDIGSSGWGRNEFLKNFSDVTIRNNYLQDVVGDGIVLTETKGGLVEGNMVNSSCGLDRGNVNYAQCWTMFADDVTVQYNEAYGNKFGYDDGEAFDSDMMNENNIFQYNLSHDCGGGAMLFMSSQRNTTFRYNVSINDGFGTYPKGNRLHQQTFHYDNTSSAGANVGKIYNNTIVVFGEGKQTALFGGSAKKTCFIDFRNNIVLAEDGAKVTFGVVENANHKSTIHKDSVIENNCFWPASIANTESGEILTVENLKAKGNIFADPKLENYKAGEKYSEFVYPLDELELLADSDYTKERIQELVKPYQLTEGSPCIQAGQRIEGMPTEDILGNTIAGRVDIGALEYSSEDEAAEQVEEVNLVTTLGTVPVLPANLQVVLEGETYQYPVEWEELTKEDCMTAGVLHVTGHLPGLSNEASAVIVVADKAESFGEVEVTTYAGIYPELPKQVSAVFEGGLTMELDVTWNPLKLEDYAHAGELTVEGRIEGMNQTCQAKVIILGQIGDGTTVCETTTVKDGYVQQNDGNKAYGASDPNVIKVKTANNAPSYTRRGLVEFDLSDQTDMLESATSIRIKMQMTRPVSDADYKSINKHFYLKVYEIDDTWEENTITWNKLPDGASDRLVIKDKKIVYTDIRDKHDNIVELDVTDWVKKSYAEDGQTTFSFLMVTDYFGEFGTGDNGGIDFASKEGAAAKNQMAPTMVLSNVYETAVEAAVVSTPAGKVPTLPETVKVTYSNGEEKDVAVEWDSIPAASYQAEGTFKVSGKAEGVNLPVICTVQVMEAMGKVISVNEIAPIIQLTGTPWEELGLPDSVTVLLDNGKEAEVGIEYWFPDNAYDAEKAFAYTCIGYLALAGHETIENPRQIVATVNVTIIEPEDKNALLVLYTEAANLINDGETDKLTEKAKADFMEAFDAASAVLVNTKATEREVHTAYTELMEVIWNMEKEENRKADTDALRDLVLIAESKNKKDYTEESYDALKEAMIGAKALLKDKNLTVADQAQVDEAYQVLQEAIDGLELKGNPVTPVKVLTGIEITSLPDKTEYTAGDELNVKGLVVEAVYDDNSRKGISGYEVSKVNMTVPGTKEVVVTYRVAVNDVIRVFADSFEITVLPKQTEPEEPEVPVVVGVEIASLPDKTEYVEGETFDSTGLSVEAVYGDGSRKTVTEFKITGADTDKAGVKEVIVTYHAVVNGAVKVFADTFEITVKEKPSDNNGDDNNGDNNNSNSSSGSSTRRVSSGSAAQWVLQGTIWKYKKADGSYAVNTWENINGKWYHFDREGNMQTGWILDGQTWYKLGTDGAMLTGWVKDESDGFWYYLDESGAMKVGWIVVNGRWYYLNPLSKGHTGWHDQGDGHWIMGTPEDGNRPLGSMYSNEMTPDGHQVDESGSRIR